MNPLPFDDIKRTLAAYFQNHAEIEVAYIFGSLAQGRTNALSDIDIAVIVDSRQINEDDFSYGYKAEVIADLMKVLKTNNIDLVILNDASILLKHRALYYGKLIYSKNEKKRIAFQMSTFNKYSDFKQLIKPHLKTGA